MSTCTICGGSGLILPTEETPEQYVCRCEWIKVLHARVSKCLPEFNGLKPVRGPLTDTGNAYKGNAIVTAAWADFLPHLLGWCYAWALRSSAAPAITALPDFKVKTKYLGHKAADGFEYKTSTLSDLDDHDLVIVRRTASKDRFIGPALYELAIQLHGKGDLWIVGPSDPFLGLGSDIFDPSDLQTELSGAKRVTIANNEAVVLAALGVSK